MKKVAFYVDGFLIIRIILVLVSVIFVRFLNRSGKEFTSFFGIVCFYRDHSSSYNAFFWDGVLYRFRYIFYIVISNFGMDSLSFYKSINLVFIRLPFNYDKNPEWQSGTSDMLRLAQDLEFVQAYGR